MSWTFEWCENCEEHHLMPEVGMRVRTNVALEAREPGGDEMHQVELHATGEVAGYVTEWFNVHVALDDGREVWIDPPDLDEVCPHGDALHECIDCADWQGDADLQNQLEREEI